MKKFVCIVLCAVLMLCTFSVSAAGSGERDLRILFTHDIHSHFVKSYIAKDYYYREIGGAARLKTLLDENSNENSLYLDAGDFSMGTLLQAAYSTDAYELRILGELGCDVTTFGNHEFDYGDAGLAEMLAAAAASGDKLPQIVQSNMITDGALTAEQHILADEFLKFGGKKYTVIEKNGLRVAIFGLFGIDCLECAPTAKIAFENYIDSAKKTVEEIKQKENPDVIICLSHSGTNGDGKTGEDFELAKAVPDINVIISGHTHSTYEEAVYCGKTIIVSAGEYLANIGKLDLTVGKNGVSVKSYSLLACDRKVKEDPEMAQKIEEYKEHINNTYLKNENVKYDDIICHSDFDFMSLEEMQESHGENTFGNLVADSYIYEAKRNGINDIDVALVGLGTVRGSFVAGDITVGEAFETCSLGVGADGSAGHPIICAYITGKELKLLAELDASLGPLVSYIKMSYSGLKFTFNEKRMLLDRVTDICLVRENGSEEQIDDKKLYKVSCNMYAANMLGMLNGLTGGLLTITPKFADGSTVENLYDCSLKNKSGNEIKEWVAFKNYLSSFDKKGGTPNIPKKYASNEGRKNKVSERGVAVVKNAGTPTIIVIVIAVILIAVIVILIATHKKRKERRKKRKEKKANKTPMSIEEFDAEINGLLDKAESVIPKENLPELPFMKDCPDIHEWYEFEHQLWDIGEELRQETVNRQKELNKEQSDRVFNICLNKNAKRGRQSFVLLLGKKCYSEYAESLLKLLSDEDVDGHIISTLNKMGATEYKEAVKPFLNSKYSWIRKEAKKYINK
ncbi:MAG: bifunctional metallophosphatase/5'-nucleotidase [Clostridiales bacterium]|nr:bifunctional metallophosphatase/5'-nucleotidase [Candidatus Equinaster intestinalis]